MNCGRALPGSFPRFGAWLCIAISGTALILSKAPASSQPVDCRELAARIAALGSGQSYSNRYDSAAQKQRADLDRAIHSARALGCDRPFSFFNAPPSQCPGLNAQIQQMQANLARMEADAGAAGSDAMRQRLIASFNAYCRGQIQSAGQPRGRGFFETLFGALNLNPPPFGWQPGMPPPADQVLPQPGEDLTPRGGSQALCVRSCDGGFFPLSVPATQSSPDELTNLCQALCPNAEVNVYTRSPYLDIKTAVSLDDDTPYSEHPNALRFQKTFDPACTCKPKGQSWAEALAPAEQILGHVRKSDIVVTPENSAELSKPKFEKVTPPQAGEPSAAPSGQAKKDALGAEAKSRTEEVTGPDGVKRRVRIIVPPL